MGAAAAAAAEKMAVPPPPPPPPLPTVLLAPNDRRVIPAHGDALKHATRALYSRHRQVKDRIHWVFNPEKDERVSRLLDWLDGMSSQLARYGVSTGHYAHLVSSFTIEYLRHNLVAKVP